MSEGIDWKDLLFLAKLIPRVCHNVNRVCFIFGPHLHHSVTDITPTHLTSNVIATLRQADHVANLVLATNGCMGAISQMPVVLIPIHFDRDAASRIPSCQRSVVLRPFVTNDFMTGTPAIPGKELPLHVSLIHICVYIFDIIDISIRSQYFFFSIGGEEIGDRNIFNTRYLACFIRLNI